MCSELDCTARVFWVLSLEERAEGDLTTQVPEWRQRIDIITSACCFSRKKEGSTKPKKGPGIKEETALTQLDG